MIYNKRMRKYLKKININDLNKVTLLPGDYQIEKKLNKKGEPFWYTRHFWNMTELAMLESGTKLTDLEWDGNEVNIDSTSKKTPIADLLRDALNIANFWERSLIKSDSHTAFDIHISIDEAETKFQRKNGVTPSVTLRFYAIRDGYHYIDSSDNFESFCQPVLCINVNS